MTQHYSVEPDRPRVRNPLDLGGARCVHHGTPEQAARGSAGLWVGRRPGAARGDRTHPGTGTGAAASAPIAETGSPAGDDQPDGLDATQHANLSGPSANGPSSTSLPTAVAQSAASIRTEAATLRFLARHVQAGRRRSGVFPRPLSQSAALSGVIPLVRSPLVARMLGAVLDEPILLSPDERYLHGHYLAYLLSGSRRRGLFHAPAHGIPQRRSRPLAPGRLLRDPGRRRPKPPSPRRPHCWTSESRSARLCPRSSSRSISPVETPPPSARFFARLDSRSPRKASTPANT